MILAIIFSYLIHCGRKTGKPAIKTAPEASSTPFRIATSIEQREPKSHYRAVALLVRMRQQLSRMMIGILQAKVNGKRVEAMVSGARHVPIL